MPSDKVCFENVVLFGQDANIRSCEGIKAQTLNIKSLSSAEVRWGVQPAKSGLAVQYEDSLKQAAMDRKAEHVGAKIKASVRRGIDGTPDI
jgi:hypothetical protein